MPDIMLLYNFLLRRQSFFTWWKTERDRRGVRERSLCVTVKVQRSAALYSRAQHITLILSLCVCMLLQDFVWGRFPHVWTYLSVCTRSVCMCAVRPPQALQRLQRWSRGYRALRNLDLHCEVKTGQAYLTLLHLNFDVWCYTQTLQL